MPKRQNTLIMISHRKGDLPAIQPSEKGGEALVPYAQFLEAMAGGLISKAAVDILRGSTDADAQVAKAHLQLSGGTGAVGAIINGVSVTATWATSDTNSAGLVAAAINASSNALVQGLVRSSNIFLRVTCGTGVAHGDILRIGDYQFEMVRDAVDREGRGQTGTVVISAVAATMAANLAAAMNAHPKFSKEYVAVVGSAVVYIFAKANAVPSVNLHSTTNATHLALTDSVFAAGAFFVVFAVQPGKLGNAQTIAATGTGVSLPNAETRLTGGVGGDLAGVPPAFVR